ncbi:MAG TPA: YbhB/YbcL family Raf kinase inhibitor-like protein [Steroidobacteraceae bacterium]|nr:YbhB/YbcL family Raf kinase inhibitor-like protein [Steroidobacteraceae bacterium]
MLGRLGPVLSVLAAAVPLTALGADFKLASPELTPGGRLEARHVFNGFGCSGGNVSPALSWSGAPAGTKSFALTVYDPDAPTGSGWWHWVLFDLPPTVTSLPAGAGDPAGGKLPKGAVQTGTDFGKPGFGGPCPPQGDKPHRYVFTLYALKVDKLGADPAATAAMVGFMLNANALEKTSFTVYYGR